MEQEMEDCKEILHEILHETGDNFEVESEEEKLRLDNEHENVAELSKLNAIKSDENKGISSMEDENYVKNATEEEKLVEEVSEEMHDCVENVLVEKSNLEDVAASNDPRENVRISTDNGTQTRSKNGILDEVRQCADEEMEDADTDKADKDVLKEQKEVIFTSTDEAATPISHVRYPPSKAGSYTEQTSKPIYTPATVPLAMTMAEDDDGTPEEQAAFMMGLQSFYKERGSEFKPPRFYQQPLNFLKLWRSVIKLGGYETVTGYKLWRQVGESFHPPKTCTTISWTFRIFYEKCLLEYEKYKIQSGELRFPATLKASGVAVGKEVIARGNSHQGLEGNSHQVLEPGRVRRDAAAQGWHSQRNGRVSEPMAKDKSLNGTPNCKRNFRSIGSLKQKRPKELEISHKVARTEMSEQLIASVIDVGPPADWVKVNVRPTADCFEVYALVPGLLREEVRVQSDPAGRLVITGQPEEIDNPWGVMPFKKVVSLPARIDPLNTSAVVSLHGGLFVRVPYEQQPT